MTKELIVIAGPTAIGKTDIGAELAEKEKSVIISADSRQFYREMTIGTAVPAKDILSRVPHYFIQNLGIRDYYNASLYEGQVIDLLNVLFQQHDRVFMVGGSGLYINAVRFGIDDLPAYDPAIRKELQNRIELEGLESLNEELKKMDPESYRKIDLNNPKRVQKALEIIKITGKPYSSFMTGEHRKRNFEVRLLCLNMDRQKLYDRINLRVISMVDRGLIDEVRGLMEFRQFNALNTVGYKEIFEYLEGRISLDEAIHEIQNHTRKFARKQLTWFRKDKGYRWFEPEDLEGMEKFIRSRNS